MPSEALLTVLLTGPLTMVSVNPPAPTLGAHELKGEPVRTRTIAIIDRWRHVTGPRHIVRVPSTRAVHDNKERDG